jgi:hypothetical protein
MNILALIMSAVQLAPYIVAGVQVIHQGESSESKTQIATNMLNVATGAATKVLPSGDDALIAQWNSTLSGIIGLFGSQTKAPAAAVAAATSATATGVSA